MTTPESLPTLGQLWRATALAVFVAGILLVRIVLPAEYGIDPTGAGRRLGPFRPRAASVEVQVAGATGDGPSDGATLVRKNAAFRSDEMSLVLESGEGAEIK